MSTLIGGLCAAVACYPSGTTTHTDLALREAGGIPAQCRYGDQPQGWKSGRRTLGSCTYLRARGMAPMHQQTAFQAPSGRTREGSRRLLAAGLGLSALALLAASPGVSAQSPAASGWTVTDDTGAAVAIPATPERVVSLSPANTEIAFALGAGDRLVGGTDFDD